MVSKVRIKLYLQPCQVMLLPENAAPSMQGREIWIVKLRGCNSLNESEVLRGQTILVSSTDRPELEDEDDFLVQVCFFALLYISSMVSGSGPS